MTLKKILWGNKLSSITIGANVGLSPDRPFDYAYFYEVYSKRRRAGTYTYADINGWTFEPTGDSLTETEKFDDDFDFTEEPIRVPAREYDEYSYSSDFLVRDYEIESLYASSELSNSQGHYSADNLINHGWEPWAEGVQGSGIGESFTFKLSGKGVISGFALKNGHGDLNYFSQNNRVKSFKIYIEFKDKNKVGGSCS